MMRTDIPLEEKLFFTYKEFGSMIGKSDITIRRWVKDGLLHPKEYSPRCWMLPRSELERYQQGKMMESKNCG
jgi:predicted site-specific integrase-resolvase